MNFRLPVKIIVSLLFFLTAVMLSGAAWVGLISMSLTDVQFLSDHRAVFPITVQDWDGKRKTLTIGPESPFWTLLDDIPENLRNAVLAGEDFSFYSHNGVDWFEVRESVIKNLRLGRYARGASTITQQLAKNLFLSRDKTLKRKIQEMILARRLERTLTKDRIFELYLNVVELGEMVYGIGQGSIYHFRKEAKDLSLRECSLLAAMLPGPKVYDPKRHIDRVMSRSDHILSVMLKGHMISEEQHLTALAEMPAFMIAQTSGDLDHGTSPETGEKAPMPDTVHEFPPTPPVEERSPQPVPIPAIMHTERAIPQRAAGNAESGSTTDSFPANDPENLLKR